MKVVDASVLCCAVGDDTDLGDRVRTYLRLVSRLLVPDIAHVEAASALRRQWMVGNLTEQRFDNAMRSLGTFPVVRYSTVEALTRISELRTNVSAYDAAYVWLAEVTGCDLVTADGRLSRAPQIRCGVHVIT
jgi:predicted nucleic acid-binding protein